MLLSIHNFGIINLLSFNINDLTCLYKQASLFDFQTSTIQKSVYTELPTIKYLTVAKNI